LGITSEVVKIAVACTYVQREIRERNGEEWVASKYIDVSLQVSDTSTEVVVGWEHIRLGSRGCGVGVVHKEGILWGPSRCIMCHLCGNSPLALYIVCERQGHSLGVWSMHWDATQYMTYFTPVAISTCCVLKSAE
jgi:hypothetical protein